MKPKTAAGKSTMAQAGQRAIIHVDMDAFYASVECLDDPSLAGKPIIVGGLGPRGVVATASYEARKFGVHSALPMSRARKLCPQAKFIRPRMDRYREKSAEVFLIFRDFTPLVEGLSLDEAFLDVGGSLKLFGTRRTIGRQVKDRIKRETGLTASVGIAENKFLAKLASDVQKPDGLVQVDPGKVHQFLDPMPVTRLWGIGKKTAPRLRALGILTIGQLRQTDPSMLQTVLGNRSEHFLRLSRGEDDRKVKPGRADKSISHEVTFDRDLLDLDELLAELQRQAEAVARRLRKQELMARTVVVKIRDPAFHTVTRSSSMRACSSNTKTLYRMARALFLNWRETHNSTPVRLLGMGVSGIEPAGSGHLAGDLAENPAEQAIDRVLDSINLRYGKAGLVHGQTLRRRKT
ncbi:MAG: DNA polymerase IV [Xanthomonadales bacterium]|nr:DNA polymerase IV [Gammaproteobacteria bacterium]MBT8052734.1 DNA polymerase IV [Gammaproteobacteria bacterium]NND55910.1 DNA polymerase IV [Xanthomonadales bacterium]NNK50608.1 DNA polymerase IV [Xanthomonadales bacterium]